jgi:hypothetical protein
MLRGVYPREARLNLHEIVVQPVRSSEEPRYQELMRQHHYLGALPKISETVWYVASWQEQWVALLSFSASALKCGARDGWIGWDLRHRYSRLKLIVNNSRFLILPNLVFALRTGLTHFIVRFPKRPHLSVHKFPILEVSPDGVLNALRGRGLTRKPATVKFAPDRALDCWDRAEGAHPSSALSGWENDRRRMVSTGMRSTVRVVISREESQEKRAGRCFFRRTLLRAHS